MASRFYALMFVGLTGILGMVSPPDLALMTAQAQAVQNRKAEADRLLQQGIQQFQISQFEGVRPQYNTIIRQQQETHTD
jgi:hypothetical protein